MTFIPLKGRIVSMVSHFIETFFCLPVILGVEPIEFPHLQLGPLDG